jgi:hyperosmotically inducible protein
MTHRIGIIFRSTVWRTGLLGVVLGLVMAGTASAVPNDTWITTKIKLALLTTGDVSGSAIHVDTINQKVTLHGKVGSDAEKAKVENIAKAIDGVKSVRNLLAVVTPKHEEAVRLSDDKIKKRVETALRSQPSLKDGDITVKSVNNGMVLLSGTTKTLADHLSAIEITGGVPGVRRVASEIQSPDIVADTGNWTDDKMAQLSDTAQSVGNASRDLYITSMTRMRLLADSRTPALDINVDTRDGVVTLFGMVPGQEAKAAAEADARLVSGVKDVKNELQVVASALQPAVQARDDDIQRDMEKAFEDHAEFKDITIQVENCVARLTGTVPTGLQRLNAGVAARSIVGVCSVENDLRIADQAGESASATH